MARHTGTVKSYGVKNGYGFITSDDSPGVEIFFSRRNMPQEIKDAFADSSFRLAGKQVTFSVEQNKQGNAQADNIQLVAQDGEDLVGKVKSYVPSKAYGFIESASVPGQDIFFGKRELNPAFHDAPLSGMTVKFKLTLAGDGKPQAQGVSPQPSSYRGGKGGKGESWGGKGDAWGGKGDMWGMWGCGKGDMWGGMWGGKGDMWGGKGSMWGGKGDMWGMMALPGPGGKGMMGKGQGQRDQAMQGVVKSYDGSKGYGFINTPMIPQDIYFKGNGENFSSGMNVSFYVNMTADGKVQAKSVSAGFSDGESMVGTVKSYNDKKGFGFLQAADKVGDVYFKSSHVPESHQGQELDGLSVHFSVRVSPDGKPSVSQMEFVDGPPGQGVKRAGGSPGWIQPAAKAAKKGGWSGPAWV